MILDKRILLASKSPRRQELVKHLGFDYQIVEINMEEIYPDTMETQKIPEYLARKKADSYTKALGENEILLTADTDVIVDDKVMGKPAARDEAIAMIENMSGKTHQVISGVCIKTRDQMRSRSCTTEVTFSALKKNMIEYYVDQFKPYDKAGAYGIQEWIGMVGIEAIKGSYYNVVGLPVHWVYAMITEDILVD